MEPVVKFARSHRMVVAFAPWVGPYSEVGEQMLKLREWLDSKGISPAGDPFCLFYDNPGETPPGELRSEACIPVAGELQQGGEFGTKVFEGTEVAETSHRGPPEEFGKTYGPFLEGLLKAGYDFAGPAREFFHGASEAKGPGYGYLIQQPVVKRPRAELE